ncbi:MAG: polysaccharide deacetylase family protein [Candidatus Omnitrophica bacterium]|nr:polysaccharide deacetylase family protein [Candidatus Omnitrophota bacterium]
MTFMRKWWLWTALLLFGALAIIFFTFPIKGHIPVLMYHLILPKSEVGHNSFHVSIESFERQMWFLKTFGYRTISLDEYYEIKTGERKPRGREVLITFDDGHRSYADAALPILERYQIPSVNFLIWEHATDKFWKDYMTLEEAKRIADHPLVTFGSHTISHPNLTAISSEQAWFEIKASKDEFEDAFQKPFHYFCYPEGSFNEEVIQLVEKAGYRLAFKTSLKHLEGFPQTSYTLRRIKVRQRGDLLAFWFSVAGFTDYVNGTRTFFRQLTANKVNDKLIAHKPIYKTT